MTATSEHAVPASLGPLIISGLDKAAELREKLEYTQLKADGRVGVEVHHLYTTADTGPGGPAASIVYYHPGAQAATHRHTGYEIILVLDGELHTEAGAHPANTLLVMPPGSVHTPHTEEQGALMLVIWESPVEPA